MERLKALVPDELRRAIAGSTCETLPSTCGRLLEFFLPLPDFQQVVNELTDLETALCHKDGSMAVELKGKGNECFSKGDFAQAAGFYSQALRYAAMDSESKNLSLAATLYVNRALSMHKLGLLEESLRDCNRAVALMPTYAKGWYRRGKVNESMHNYKDAIHDLEVALITEITASGKRNINQELQILRAKAADGVINTAEPSDDNVEIKDIVTCDISVVSVTSISKGRGMASPNDIMSGSLIHTEDPLAAIINKPYRSTHCHFCFNKLPTDCLFCPSCTIPVYCSESCLFQSTGEIISHPNNPLSTCNFSEDILNHVKDVICKNRVICDGVLPEHRHECGGTHWAAVLPVDIVLAGRILARDMEKRRLAGGDYNVINLPDLVHHYDLIPPSERLELCIYAIVLCFCMNSYYKSDFLCTEFNMSQLVLLICQIKINSMAVVHISSADGQDSMPSPIPNIQTSNIEQTKVGQAIYTIAGLFNHSCKPNINSYFISRTLFIRTTESVPSWAPLELSYGPQVGEMDIAERQRLLKQHYMFECECLGCSNMNFSDLVINSLRCQNSKCCGVVLQNITLKKLNNNSLQALVGTSLLSNLAIPGSGSDKSIAEVAHKLFHTTEIKPYFTPGYCLNCNSYLDLDSVNAGLSEASLNMTRLMDSVDGALEYLEKIKSMRHQYSKAVAQVEDSVAEIFAKNGDFEHAITHCKLSIQILEKLYHPNHIALGHELIKLASLQLSLHDASSASQTIDKVEAIFSLYYGAHTSKLFPYVNILKQQIVDRLISCNLKITS